jgi:hypothetical protein
MCQPFLIHEHNNILNYAIKRLNASIDAEARAKFPIPKNKNKDQRQQSQNICQYV